MALKYSTTVVPVIEGTTVVPVIEGTTVVQ